MEHTVTLNEKEYQIFLELFKIIQTFGKESIQQMGGKYFQEQTYREKLVAELYNNDNITLEQARGLLGVSSKKETAAILKQLGCELYYDKDEFSKDTQTIKRFFDGVDSQ